ncbi:hypothetical protein SDC9_146896 [bioreactor metagenome]|uniref:Uncharacterized protein n=1 Tax=bioreactor metagenome TaxID=1076179 RepID=A0A645EGH9_9ZZZZ
MGFVLVACSCADEDRPDETGGCYLFRPIDAGLEEITHDDIEHDKTGGDDDAGTCQDKFEVG